MVASVLTAAHLEPNFRSRWKLNQAGTTARLGKGEYFVVEADESDRSFLYYAPVVAVVTTIDREHLDPVQLASKKFSLSSSNSSIASRFMELPSSASMSQTFRPSSPASKRPIITYGTSTQADLVHQRCQHGRPRQRISPHLQRRRPRHVHLIHPPGNSQCPQCGRRRRSRALSQCPIRSNPRRPSQIHRGRPALRH